jgi:hypothetical protein
MSLGSPHASSALLLSSSVSPGATLSAPQSPQRTSGSENVSVNGSLEGGSTVTERTLDRIGRSSGHPHVPHDPAPGRPSAMGS